MGKTIIHGVKENGLLDAEFKCTAVLVTELINNQHKMSEWEIYKALTEIREAAERDARTAHAYAAALKAKKRRATMGKQLTMISIPKGERTDLVKRRWENAFQKWSAEKERAYKTVYNDLIKCGLFIGRYDAKNGNEHFMYGVLTVMEVIAEWAGKYDEFKRLFIHNMLESEEKVR